MKRLKLFFACLLMAVLSIGQVWADEGDTHAISSSDNSSFPQQAGLNNNATISSASITGLGYTVKKVELSVRTNKTGSNVDIEVVVGETSLGTQNKSGNNTATLTFQTDPVSSLSGDITINFTNKSGTGTGLGSIWLNTVTLTEGASAGGDPVDPTITFNNGSVDAGYTLDLSTLFTSNSNGEVTYSITAGSTYASIDGSVLTGVLPGSVTVQASQAATASYNAATANSTITVNEHVVTPGQYGILLANAFWGTSGTGASAGHTASGIQNDIAVSISGNSGTQNYINDTETRIYGSHTLTFSVPTGYVLTEITGLGTADKSSISVASGSTGSITTRVWTGSANSVTFAIGGRTDFSTVSVTFALASSSPEVSVSPELWDFGTVHAGDAASKVFSVSGSNLTAGDLTLTAPAGFSVSPSSIAVDGTLEATEVTVSKNTSTVNDYSGNLEITGGGLASAKTVALTMSVDADPAPTGTFKKFTGDLTAGKYVICDGTNAMKNTATSAPRIEAATVTVNAEDKIVNPDANVVWNVEFLTGDDAAYFTLYNEDASKYAAFTSTTARGTVVDAVTDYAKWQYSEKEFSNKGLSGKYLRFNDGYGFASYATTTGNELTLYKLDDGTPNPPTFSPAGGSFLEAQSVTISAETGATIYYTTDGTAPTTSSSVYSAAIPVSTTTTIKAIAVKDEKSSSVASATYTITTIKSVDEIWDEITASGPEDAYVWGYVSQTNVSGYANNFYISVNGSTEGNQLYAYRMNMNSFSVAIGDKVTLNGDLTINGTTKQFKYTNADNCGKVIALVAKGELQSIAISGSATKTEYAANETFEYGGLKVMGTYANGFVGEITEGITWNDDLTDHKVTENTTVHVTATVGDKTSPACNVAVTVAAKTLVSIAATPASSTIYTGEVLPEPIITATYSEGPTADVSAEASYDTENAFDTETLGDQTITVSYTFGGETKTTTYTVTVIDYANDVDHPYTPEEALYITINAVGSTKATKDIYVQGIVSRANAVTGTNKRQRYWISIDGETTSTEFEVYNGKYLAGADFSTTNQLIAGDEVIVKGKVIYYNSTTPEFATGESQLESLARTPNFTITDVAEFEVGATDLAVADLTIVAEGEGAVTFASSDNTDAVTIVDGKLHAVAAGTATITANLAADGIYKAATATFDVTVIAATTKYTITFDGNGADGGSAPAAIAAQPEGAEVALPGNTYTKTNKIFDGWKVINNTTTEEVTVTAGKFTMPASAVTIQAQWANPSVWALTYTSNVALTANSSTKSYAEKVKITVEEVLTEFDALRACTGSAAGSCTVKVPAGTQTLHFHAAAWNAKTSTITVTMGETELLVQALAADAGIKNSSPYTLEGIPYEYYYSIDLSSYSLTEETTITFSAGSDKRFVLFGVNQEGGIVPVLESIEIKGDLTTKTGYKAGDALNLDGLTVEATYSIGGVAQTPVDITDKLGDGLTLTYDPLVENQTEVTITASYKGQTDDITITGLDPVASADPKIYVSTLNVDFGSVVKDAAAPADQTITVTLTNVANATATLGGTNPEAFSIDPATLTASGDITISIADDVTATAGTYSATITIKDDADAAEQKVVNLAFEVTDESVRKTWNLTIASYVSEPAPTSELIQWTATYVSMKNERNGSGNTAVNNYIPTAQTSTRFYKNNELTITPNGKEITSVVFTATTTGYANALQGSEWTNATASVDDKTVTVTPIDGENAISAVVGNTCGFTSVQVNYKEITPEPPTPTADYTRGVTIGNYGTICLPNGGNISGAKLFDLEYYDGGASTLYLLEVEGNAMVAGRPYIFLPSVATIEVFYTDDADADAGSNNGLIGWLGNENKLIAPDAGNYILYQSQYWFVNSEAYVTPNHAYIHMDDVPTEPLTPAPGAAPRRRVSMAVNGENAATGFENIESGDAPMKVMIEGTMYILRGEKVYDATGRLVK